LQGTALSALALPALALPSTARAEIPKSLVVGSMHRFKPTNPPKPVPDLQFLDMNDQPVRLSDWDGQARLINLWATWCAPCVKEMPSLDRLQATMPRDRFMILPISLDSTTRAKVPGFYRQQDLASLPIFYDKLKKAMTTLHVELLPTSILIDPQGRELGRLEGDAEWDTPEGIALMRAAMTS
jgi:thiol-disulfide isomerase/thioredoxin